MEGGDSSAPTLPVRGADDSHRRFSVKVTHQKCILYDVQTRYKPVHQQNVTVLVPASTVLSVMLVRYTPSLSMLCVAQKRRHHCIPYCRSRATRNTATLSIQHTQGIALFADIDNLCRYYPTTPIRNFSGPCGWRVEEENLGQSRSSAQDQFPRVQAVEGGELEATAAASLGVPGMGTTPGA